MRRQALSRRYGCAEANFEQSMADAGLAPPEPPLADGEIHRFHVHGDKRGSANGWYVLDPDRAFGAFGSWKTGHSQKWRGAAVRKLSRSEQRTIARRIQRIQRRRQSERLKRQHQAQQSAETLWLQAAPASADHPYLLDKQVSVWGIRQSGNTLLIPVRDPSGRLWSLQLISPEGRKRFLSGGKLSGHYHSIGHAPDAVLLIAEGYATGATLFEQTGYPVAVAFTAGNLEPVATALRQKYPHTRLVICADNDQWTAGNPGLSKARKAALAVNGVLVFPEFSNGEDKPTDFNDLARLRE